MPLLHSHYSSFITTTHDSATVLRIGTLALTGSPLERLPLHRSDSFPSSTPAPVIPVTPPLCRMPPDPNLGICLTCPEALSKPQF